MAKMSEIEKLTQHKLEGLLPHLHISCSDNLMSNVYIAGSFDKRDDWNNGIFENSKYFKVHILPEKGKRFYDENDQNVTLSMITVWKCQKIRKYTGSPEKVVDKLVSWIKENA